MSTFVTKSHLITRYGTHSSPHHCLIDAAGIIPLPSSTLTSSTGCVDAALLEVIASAAVRWPGLRMQPNSVPAEFFTAVATPAVSGAGEA